MEASMIKLFLMRDKRETSSQIEDHKKRLYNQLIKIMGREFLYGTVL